MKALEDKNSNVIQDTSEGFHKISNVINFIKFWSLRGQNNMWRIFAFHLPCTGKEMGNSKTRHLSILSRSYQLIISRRRMSWEKKIPLMKKKNSIRYIAIKHFCKYITDHQPWKFITCHQLLNQITSQAT